MDEFAGRVVHPQRWPEDFDYAGQRVVVIGSGATAVTLVPAMAERAAHAITRWQHVVLAIFFYGLSRRRPGLMKKMIACGRR